MALGRNQQLKSDVDQLEKSFISVNPHKYNTSVASVLIFLPTFGLKSSRTHRCRKNDFSAQETQTVKGEHKAREGLIMHDNSIDINRWNLMLILMDENLCHRNLVGFQISPQYCSQHLVVD